MPIRTFTLDWAPFHYDPPLDLAIGQNRISLDWFIMTAVTVRPGAQRVLRKLNVVASADPAPRPLPNGHHIVGIKN